MPQSSGRRGPLQALRVRLRILEAGLFLPVVVTGVIGIGYLREVRARQRTADTAAGIFAQRVMDRTVVLASQIGDRAADAVLGPLQDLPNPTPERLLARMRAATDSLRACQCGPLKEGSHFFHWSRSADTVAWSSDSPVGPDAHHRLRAALMAPGAGQHVWAAGGLDAGEPWLYHLIGLATGGVPTGVAGFDISMASWWGGTFLPAIAASRREFFPMLGNPDTAFSARLLIGNLEVARDGPTIEGPGVSMDLRVVPPFRLAVTVNPAVLPLLLAPATPDGSRLVAGALGASVLVSVLALVLLRQVRRTMAQREAFVASISHELRTPLTEMLLHAESLHFDRHTPEAKARAAEAIVRETRRLVGLVENTLTIAGAGRALAPAEGTVTAAARVVREALDALAPAAADRDVRIEAHLDPAAQCGMDPVSLGRVVTNLVENALRYGPEGQTVQVSLTIREGGIRLEVDDAGPGVLPRERALIWEAFERGTAAQPASTGLGLGLAIVKHLVTGAEGRVTVGEAPGGGARFTVLLPGPVATAGRFGRA